MPCFWASCGLTSEMGVPFSSIVPVSAGWAPARIFQHRRLARPVFAEQRVDLGRRHDSETPLSAVTPGNDLEMPLMRSSGTVSAMNQNPRGSRRRAASRGRLLAVSSKLTLLR
jgi:hypothetical protein